MQERKKSFRVRKRKRVPGLAHSRFLRVAQLVAQLVRGLHREPKPIQQLRFFIPMVGDQEVEGSNPFAPTTFNSSKIQMEVANAARPRTRAVGWPFRIGNGRPVTNNAQPPARLRTSSHKFAGRSASRRTNHGYQKSP